MKLHGIKLLSEISESFCVRVFLRPWHRPQRVTLPLSGPSGSGKGKSSYESCKYRLSHSIQLQILIRQIDG